MTEMLSRPAVPALPGVTRFASRDEYAAAYPYCQAYPANARCSSGAAVPGYDYVAQDTYWFGDDAGGGWLVTFSRHLSDLPLPRGEGRGNVVACHVGTMGPPLHWGGSGAVLVLAENIVMDETDALLTESPRPNTLAEICRRLASE